MIMSKSTKSISPSKFAQMVYKCIKLVLARYHEQMASFNQKPFFRIFFNIIFDIQRPEYQFKPQDQLDMYKELADFFVEVSPLKYPAFSYSWLELISNRYLLSSIMSQVSCPHLAWPPPPLRAAAAA